MDSHDTISQKPSFTAHPEYSQYGLKKLYNKALNSLGKCRMAKCSYLYRNKDQKYFEDMVSNKNSIMNPYFKDSGNDPLNPMNKRLGGLFFMASVNSSGEVPEESSFGNTRLMIPVETLMTDVRLYFADFFCLQGRNHYVTLVACKPGTKTDTFCQQKLIQISLTENKFFTFVGFGNCKVSNHCNVFVEIVITQPIDLKKELKHSPNMRTSYIIYGVPIVGCGYSKKQGVLKNDQCDICNIQTDNHECIQVRSKEKFKEFRHYQGSNSNIIFVFTRTGKYVHTEGEGHDWLVHNDESSVDNTPQGNNGIAMLLIVGGALLLKKLFF